MLAFKIHFPKNSAVSGINVIDSGGMLVIGRGNHVDLRIAALSADGAEVVLVAKGSGVLVRRVGRAAKVLLRDAPFLDVGFMAHGDAITIGGIKLELRVDPEYSHEQENLRVRQSVSCARSCKTKSFIPRLPVYLGAEWICDNCAKELRSSWKPTEGEPTRLGGFDIVGPLGEGGMGKVYEAIQAGTGIRAALKTINIPPIGQRLEEQQVVWDRFVRREQRILQALNHPNVIQHYESGVGGEKETIHYIAMEYVGGGSAHRVGRTPPGEAPVATRTVYMIARDLFRALAYLHEFGFVHRDIKPHNLLLTVSPVDGTPRAKLADMGMAKSDHDLARTKITKVGDVGGTLLYMPFEQLRNFRDVDKTADIYSAAVTVYWMLAGKTPQGYAHGGFNDLQEQRAFVDELKAGKHIPLEQQISPHHRRVPESLMKKLDHLTQPKKDSRLLSHPEDIANMFDALIRSGTEGS